MLGQLLAFAGVAALVIITPGPDTALTVRNTLMRGRRAGVLTAVGVATGQAMWALFTAAGLASLLRASQPAFEALRLAGAAYLILLGLRSLVSHGVEPEQSRQGAPFRQGLLSNLANPKMVAFFVGLLPPFASGFPALLALGIAFAAMTCAWLSGYAVAVAYGGEQLLRPRVRRAIERLTGVVLVGLGLRLATERS
jgi:threonine/homoserine/homoserine lactone efflux protein